MEGKVCKTCKEFKNFKDFPKCKPMIDGHRHNCKTCENKLSKLRKMNNDEKTKQKICVSCGELKYLVHFQIDIECSDGFKDKCSDCFKNHTKERLINKAQKEQFQQHLKENKLKYCSNCKEIKNPCEFSKNKSSYDGLESYCKCCRSEHVSDYFKTDNGREKAHDAIARRSKRAKDVGGEFTMKQKKAIFKRDKGVCQCCGIPVSMERYGNASFDHRIAVWWGGRSTMVNGQLLCGYCNSSKGSKLDQAYLTIIPNPEKNIVMEIMNDKFKKVLKMKNYSSYFLHNV